MIITHKATSKSGIKILGALIIFFLLFIAIIFAEKHIEVAKKYASAEEAIMLSCYSDAQKELNQIKNKHYKDTDSLILLCEAHDLYEIGEYEAAKNLLNEAEFRYLSEEQLKEVNLFRSKISRKIEKKKTDTNDKWHIVVGIPSEGMPEYQLSHTALGRPTRTELCKDFFELKESHRYKKYIWEKDGVKICEATVRYWDYSKKQATSGYVSNVWLDPTRTYPETYTTERE